MAQDRLPNLPDTTTAGRRERSEAFGGALQSASGDAVGKAPPYSPEERLAAALGFQRRTPPGPRTPPDELIREDRDR
jgi:hypothetical protein